MRARVTESADRTGNRPVGYALVVGDGHLAELVVHPTYRREGRGRALLEAVIERLEPGTRMTLTVAVGNDPARALYESVGFREIGRQPEFFEVDAGGRGRDAGERNVENEAWNVESETRNPEPRTVDAAVYAYDVPEEC
ncbi:GNAT family N-acetyltransferase [Halobellus captivus]|uniref:GNAT family N-acetyltransferase n=1 Tax=Halobellus captivus TaxID=2592614 RepID=UPI00308466B3